MANIKSDISLAESRQNGLKSKCIGLGTGTIEIAQASNISGVKDIAEVYEECANLLELYKAQLDVDADHIKDLGVNFFDFDHKMASQM